MGQDQAHSEQENTQRCSIPALPVVPGLTHSSSRPRADTADGTARPPPSQLFSPQRHSPTVPSAGQDSQQRVVPIGHQTVWDGRTHEAQAQLQSTGMVTGWRGLKSSQHLPELPAPAEPCSHQSAHALCGSAHQGDQKPHQRLACLLLPVVPEGSHCHLSSGRSWGHWRALGRATSTSFMFRPWAQYQLQPHPCILLHNSWVPKEPSHCPVLAPLLQSLLHQEPSMALSLSHCHHAGLWHSRTWRMLTSGSVGHRGPVCAWASALTQPSLIGSQEHNFSSNYIFSTSEKMRFW